ncbi:MAG: helix-turn-helix transcriptional regulator [Deltaproteobacteria bacterium]|nr:helix-turn-helix transcriptional regulator [Deltaproteobacteria bacterium]
MFKERLKLLRIEKGLTQEQLGKMVNLAQQTISHYEKGALQPDLKSLVEFAKIFQTTTDYLLGVTNDRYKPEYANTAHKLLNELTEKEKMYVKSFLKYLIAQRDEQAAAGGK